MSDKRPTRTQVAQAYGCRTWEGLGENTQAMLERVVGLFGGFAPEPMEVPRVACYLTALGPVIAKSGSSGVLGSQLTEDQADAVVARSNAWERIRLRAGALLRLSERKSWSDVQVTTRALFDLLSSPEFGTGPEVKP